MRSALATATFRAGRKRSASLLSAIPPAQDSEEWLPELAACAASIVYKSPLPSPEGHPIFIINAAALPDTYEVDYDTLLPYVLARLPDEDDLIHGTEYEIIFFAGGQVESATSEKKQGPGIGWYVQAYHVLSRAMRKRLQKLYIVHPKTYIRVLISVFSTVVSPKFRRKIVHVSNLTALERYTPIVNLLIPPAVFLYDRKLEDEIDTMANGLVFGTRHPLPKDLELGHTRLPRMLRETSRFLLMGANAKTEGLFRIPPHAVLTDILQEAYDRGQKFIVWKDNGQVLAHPGVDESLLAELTIDDAYGVHLAAALIKAWYRELAEPVFPESSYAYLKSNFVATSSTTIDDLETLISPKSATSVLTTTSREILTRHLLPLLANVCQFEHNNKMDASNLAICFGMALLRGSDEMEDAKMISTVKVVIESAILQWPELRDRLRLSPKTFMSDLDNPDKMRLYEDPLPEHAPNAAGQSHAWKQRRSMLLEDDTHKADHKLHIPRLMQRLPLIAKPQELAKDAAAMPPPPVPKRKPAPNVSREPSQTYDAASTKDSLTSDSTDDLITLTDSASEVPYVEASKPVVQRKPAPPIPAPLAKPAAMPKRKAVTAEPAAVIEADTKEVVAPAGDSTEPKPFIFRKPSWPASANRQPALNSLARPVLPAIQQPTSIMTNTSNLSAQALPKPRMPSPGLLQRMNTIERLGATVQHSPEEERRQPVLPGRLSLKKASVDDLRRLYEDRLNTVDGLARANVMQRSYSQS